MMNGKHAYLLRVLAATRGRSAFLRDATERKGRLMSGALNPRLELSQKRARSPSARQMLTERAPGPPWPEAIPKTCPDGSRVEGARLSRRSMRARWGAPSFSSRCPLTETLNYLGDAAVINEAKRSSTEGSRAHALSGMRSRSEATDIHRASGRPTTRSQMSCEKGTPPRREGLSEAGALGGGGQSRPMNANLSLRLRAEYRTSG